MGQIEANEAGWRFRYPSELQLRSRERADEMELSLSDYRDPRNFFGFKMVLHRRPLAEGETRTDSIAVLEARLSAGTAKRNFTEASRGAGLLAGLAADEIIWEYTLDAGRVEYEDPDGRSRSAGDESIPLRVRALISGDDRNVLAAWLIAEQARYEELSIVFSEFLDTVRWQSD